jgi:hypothetical protein
MKLDVFLNQTDYTKYTPAAIRFWSKKRERRFNSIDAIGLIAIFIILLILFLGNWNGINWFSLGCGFLLGFFFLFLVLNEQKKILQPKEMGYLLSPANYDFNSEGFKAKKNYFETEVKWQAIEAVLDSKEYFYLFTDYNFAHIIPKRFFTSPEKIDEFRSLLETLLAGKIYKK